MKFIRPRQVLEMIGVSRTTLWRMVQAGSFPAPVRITERNSGYVLDAVEEWMKTRAAGLDWEPHAAVAEAKSMSSPLAFARGRRANG